MNLPPKPPNSKGPCGGGQCDYDLLIAVDPSNPAIIYFGGVDLYKSTDGGVSWTDLGGYAPGGIHPDQHALAFLPGAPSTIFSGNDGGIWKSTNRGAAWTNLNSGLGLAQFYSLAGSPGSFLIGGVQDDGCVKYSGSSSWPEVAGGDGGWSGVETSNPSILYCNYINLNFRKSTDGGNTWNYARTGIDLSDKSEFIAPATQDSSTSGTLYIGGTHVYKTANFASTWTDVSGSLGSSLISVLAVAPSSSATVYLGDESGNLKVSTNGGTTWQTLSTFAGYPISSLAVDPTDANLIYVAVASQNTPYKFALQSGAWQKTQLAAAPDQINVVRSEQLTARFAYLDPDKRPIVAGSTPATTRFARFCNRRAEPNAIQAVSSRAFLSWSGLRRLSTERRSITLRTWTFLKCSPICARSVNISRRQSWCWSVLREDTANGVGVHPRG